MWEGYAIIVRHGVTNWDSSSRGPRVEGHQQPSERVTGWLDLPLRAEGVQEVLRTSKALQQYPIDFIATSPLQRAMVTARAVQRLHPRVPLHPYDQLKAWNTGLFSGQLASKVQGELDYAVTHPDLPIPMGESFTAFVQRLLPFALALIQHRSLCCLVTHGMNVEVLIHYRKTGTTTFQKYTGINASIQPGEAMLITPTGMEELAA